MPIVLVVEPQNLNGRAVVVQQPWQLRPAMPFAPVGLGQRRADALERGLLLGVVVQKGAQTHVEGHLGLVVDQRRAELVAPPMDGLVEHLGVLGQPLLATPA
jgi:hypothetical protein